MSELTHLSYSSISAYLACPANWKFKYLDNLPTQSTPDLLFGSAFHNTIEALYKEPGDVVNTWTNQWNAQLEKNPNLQWIDDRPEEMFNLGVKMLTHSEIQAGLSQIKPMMTESGPAIETKVELHVPGVPLPIIGYIDIITSDGVPGDFKTSGMSWSSDKAIAETQTLFYLAALSQLGKPVKDGRFRHFIFVKTKTPKFQMLEHVHRPQEMFWLFGMIQKVWNGINTGVFPENPSSWKCSAKYCDFWSVCRGR